jgi:hypothetical protein
MTLHDLLGHAGPDIGCDACLEIMDQAAEARAAGEDVGRRFPDLAAHLRYCAACREDLEGLAAQIAAADARG